MRALLSFATMAAAVMAGFFTLADPVHAQRPWGADAGRAARPGAYVPYDGAPFSHRYNYPDDPLFLWGGYGRNWWYQYELDREERFEKFGTRYGPEYPPLFNRLLDRWRR
jgi:hypothetical protein